MGPKSLVGRPAVLLLYSDRKFEFQIVTIGSLCLDRFVIRAATLLDPKSTPAGGFSRMIRRDSSGIMATGQARLQLRACEETPGWPGAPAYFGANSGAASIPFDV